jgi:4-amino-4-deoxy-L-arabinose transferase-like glycosyltransferase
LFGAHEWAARLPDVVLGVCLIPVFFRLGNLFGNANTGYLAAFFWATSGFLPELISGRQMLDHNDFVFISYVSLSVWCYAEYYFSHKKKWIYVLGMFAGIAVLCKWLPGLFVFLIWALLIVIKKHDRMREIRNLLMALVITCSVAAPWQIYTFLRFPEVASREYAMNARHFFEVIEGHAGPPEYHLLQMNLIYGRGAMLIIPCLLVLFVVRYKKQCLGIAMLLSVVFVYIFFSLAKTKMPAFTAVAMMPLLLISAITMAWLIERIQRNTAQWLSILTVSLMLALLAVWRIDPVAIAKRHGLTDRPEGYWLSMKHNASLWRNMQLPDNGVIFNANHGTFIECMFYTGRPAYDFLPETEHLQELREHGLVAVVIDADTIAPLNYDDAYDVVFDFGKLMKEY